MKKIYKITFGMVAALLIAACADDKEFAEFTKTPQSGRTVTVSASMPGGKSVSKIGLVQSDNSLNIITKWQSADEVQIFVSQNGNSYAVGKSTVQNISEDGKSCSFSFNLPTEISADAPYSVYGFCGIDGKLENGTITIDATAKRIPLEKMKAPCYFVTQPTSANFEAKFNHIGTYEILHVANKSASDITFTHNGYTTSAPWYYNALHGTLPCSTSTGTLTNTGADGEAVSESTTIPAGTTASIVSWYMPTGGALSEAVLNAAINGNAVKSSNTKSSTVSIQNGKAYHLYATWNGTELRFLPKENPDNPPVSDEYVDLGLPSGTLWATCNVGADNPWDYGDDFAWGETEPKDDNSWATYKYANGSKDKLTKYCTDSEYGDNGFIDNLTVLEPQDDAATVNMGSEWRMPTKAEFQELIDNCDCKWTDDFNGTGVAGRLMKSRRNSNFIFLPARSTTYLNSYWLSSLTSDPSCAEKARLSEFTLDIDHSQRRIVCPIRAVRCETNVVIDMSFPPPPIYTGEVSKVHCKVSRDCSVLFYIDDNLCYTENSATTAGFDWQLLQENSGAHILTARAFIDGKVVGEKRLICEIMESKSQSDIPLYVDLGLPSGTLWATCNVGAKNPWDYGDYFAWGETEPKDCYEEENYKYGSRIRRLTKYCHDSEYGDNGFTDDLTVLLPQDDAATVNIGSDWRMPTIGELKELLIYCDWSWTDDYYGTGVSGMILRSMRNSNSIFLPAGGIYSGSSSEGYWSSSLRGEPYYSYMICVNSKGGYTTWYYRFTANLIRPVRCRI